MGDDGGPERHPGPGPRPQGRAERARPCARTAGGSSRSSPSRSCSPSSSTSTWAAFQNKNYYVGRPAAPRPLSPLYSPCIANSCVPGGVPPRPAQLVELLPRAADPDHPGGLPGHLLLLPAQLLPRLLVVAARRARSRTTTRTLQRRDAPARSCSRTRTGTSSTWRFLVNLVLTYDAILAFSMPGDGGIGVSVGTIVLVVQRRSCSGCTRSAATPAATCAAATSGSFSDAPAPPAALEARRRRSTRGTSSSPGRASSSSR